MLKVQLLSKEFFILYTVAVTSIHVRYVECSWVYLPYSMLMTSVSLAYLVLHPRCQILWSRRKDPCRVNCMAGLIFLETVKGPSSDPSTATVSAQLLNKLIIIVLSKPSHAATCKTFMFMNNFCLENNTSSKELHIYY